MLIHVSISTMDASPSSPPSRPLRVVADTHDVEDEDRAYVNFNRPHRRKRRILNLLNLRRDQRMQYYQQCMRDRNKAEDSAQEEEKIISTEFPIHICDLALERESDGLVEDVAASSSLCLTQEEREVVYDIVCESARIHPRGYIQHLLTAFDEVSCSIMLVMTR